MPGVQINLPSLRFNFGVVKVFKYGTGVGGTYSTTGAGALIVSENVRVALLVAFVAVIV